MTFKKRLHVLSFIEIGNRDFTRLSCAETATSTSETKTSGRLLYEVTDEENIFTYVIICIPAHYEQCLYA